MRTVLDFKSLKSIPALERNVYWDVLIKFPNKNEYVSFVATEVEFGNLKFPAVDLQVFGMSLLVVGVKELPEITVSFLDTDDLVFRKMFEEYFDYLYDEFGRMRVLSEAVIDLIIRIYDSQKRLLEEKNYSVLISDSTINWKGVSKPQFISKDVTFMVVGW